MLISVIIPTRNRADLLAQALASLKKQTLSTDNFEVVVVDNGSTDDTYEIVRNFMQDLRNLRYFFEPEPGLHAGRHRGMHEAHGEILAFADDDIEAMPTWVAAIRSAFEDSGVALVGGNNFPHFVGSVPAWLLKLWDLATYDGGRALPSLSILDIPGPVRVFDANYIWGCNYAIRKSVLLAACGFHPDGMPRELIRFRGDGETHVSNYVRDSGLKSLFHPEASIFHKVTPERMTFDYFYQRRFNQGVSDSYSFLRKQGARSDIEIVSPSAIRRVVRSLRRRVKYALISSPEIRHVIQQMDSGYSDGYLYHQQAYQSDEDLRSWVHKKKYYDDLPSESIGQTLEK